eukprot:TRINITY_DN9414_c0_g1_i1.p1 TRINITY_DN9414_c0_g1~~TRINITY_DN9414_c0_g1_i1.p1  ORF type:complete len:320 (-),score=73.48 TRINITY_DN9414_c0_g1_i1:22-981(-)
MSDSTLLTEDEAKLYDRQIRLWGLDAQRRMRDAKVLLIGIKGLNSEVCKNIVLAGVNSVTILDGEQVSELDLGAQIFLEGGDVGKNRADASVRNISILNPLVKINIDQHDVTKKEDSFFAQFNVVCATNCSMETLKRIDSVCRAHSIYFFGADTFGYFGYFFSDLVSYKFPKKVAEDQPQPEQKEIITVNFGSLQAAMNVKWSTLKRTAPKLFFGIFALYEFREKNGRMPTPADVAAVQQIARDKLNAEHVEATFLDDNFLQTLTINATSEISPVCAILGGILGQEIIKVISAKDEPLSNFFFYNALDFRRPGDVVLIS